MEFHKFIQIIKTYCDPHIGIATFMSNINENIMEIPYTNEAKVLNLAEKYYPIKAASSNYREQLYSGNRPLSKTIASKILKYLDKSGS